MTTEQILRAVFDLAMFVFWGLFIYKLFNPTPQAHYWLDEETENEE